nr:K-box region and MADS-box transcription factor family protein [Tanacetum cinerariifolium]
VESILSRYEKSCAEIGEGSNRGAGTDLEFLLQSTRFRTCNELLQTVDRLVEENNEQFSVNDMMQLEQELDAALMQTRLRKKEYAKGLRRVSGGNTMMILLPFEEEQAELSLSEWSLGEIRDKVVFELKLEPKYELVKVVDSWQNYSQKYGWDVSKNGRALNAVVLPPQDS